MKKYNEDDCIVYLVTSYMIGMYNTRQQSCIKYEVTNSWSKLIYLQLLGKKSM